MTDIVDGLQLRISALEHAVRVLTEMVYQREQNSPVDVATYLALTQQLAGLRDFYVGHH